MIIYEVTAKDLDYLKMIFKARLNLEEDIVLAMSRILEGNGAQETASMCDSSWCEIRDARSRPKRSQHFSDGSHLRKGLRGCPFLFGAQAIPIR